MKALRHYQGAQIRIAPDSDGKKLIGLAIPYNSLSRDLGGFQERFMPGSVSDSVKGGNICAVLNHNLSQSLGTQQSGSLRLFDKADGLYVEIDVPDTSYARDAMALIKRGDGTGMSCGFNPVDTKWIKESGTNIAEVRRAELGEVSVLTGPPPAYEATSIAVRSAEQSVDLAEYYGIDFERLASVFVAIKKGLPLTDAETQVMQQARCLFADVRKPLLEAAEKLAASVLL